MTDYDAWKTTPPDDMEEPAEECPHCGTTGPCASDCATQEPMEPAEEDLFDDCEVA